MFYFFFTMDDHIEVPLVVSGFIRGYTLKSSGVRHLSAGHDQPPPAGRHSHPMALFEWFPIFVPPGR